MQTLKSLIEKAGLEVSEESEISSRNHHRGNTIEKRPEKEYKLLSIYEEDFERKKTQKDPTEDLVWLPRGNVEKALSMITDVVGYLVWCSDTEEMWWAPSKLCLNQNFIYRKDLEICEITTREAAQVFYAERSADLMPGIITKRKCYILDNPAGECYEVYYDSSYPSLKYGKATPNGMFVYVYDNRFHRDMAIMELDKLYSEASKHTAKELVGKQLKPNEAIVVSDGAWMKETCTSACFYLDNDCVLNLVNGKIPSEPDQAVLIAEITGATLALGICRSKGKKRITYYYDNTSIVNVFKNRKTEYIAEIKEYKELLETMNSEGYQIQFVELHPKTGESEATDNKALCYFHNNCDRECREMADIFKKDYKTIASTGSREGKDYSDIRRETSNKGNNFNRNKNTRSYR